MNTIERNRVRKESCGQRKPLRILRRTGKFGRNDSGNATIELVIWMPILLFFFVMVADASFIFFGQNQVHTIIQEGNRRLSVGRLSTPLEVKTYVTQQLSVIAPSSEVTSEYYDGSILTVAKVKTSDLVAVGAVQALTGAEMTIGSRYYIEY